MNQNRKATKDRNAIRRYAAKLLFQSRHVRNVDRLKRRMCEERIFVYEARSARAALRMAKRQGRALSYSYEAIGGVTHYEFIGIMELLFLDRGYMEPNEIWLEFAYRVTPMERRAKLVRADAELHAICSGK